MPNNYFQFKQFLIYQDKCSMKVCTDACILGAWVAETIAEKLAVNNCMDIGTGTGLLSLMLAQKSAAQIDAVEINEEAFNQAADNFRRSPWGERLQAFNADVKHYVANKKYDLIITNPPFYQDDLLSPVINKNVAKHNDALTLDELILVIKNNLGNNGNFVLLLPFHRMDYFENIAKKNNFFLKEKLLIKPSLNSNYFRCILLFDKQQINSPLVKQLVIKSEDGNYTNNFKQLMCDYYLNLYND